MEISGVISRSFYGVGIDKVSVKSRKFSGISRSSAFLENGHLQYYVSPPMSGLKNKEKKEKKNLEMGIIKKKLKLVKGLSKNLSMFESMGFGLEMENGLISQVKGKNLEKASEILMAQLKQLKAEEKEMKRKKKEEKAKQKSMKMKTESSSSSSESSDSDCGDVVNMKSLRINTTTESKVGIEGESTSPISSSIQEIEIGSSRQDCCAESTSCCSSSGIGATANTSTLQRSSATVMATLDGERIEVCMGGKCKKSGAAELLQEFEKRVGGGSVAVVGCKCMGKCRDGPNVRVLNQCNGERTTMVEEIKAPLVTNPLCIGVGLEDVSMIVANFFGNQERNDLGGLMAPA
ncbi:hypothetical protein C5167_017235 [Papaver somniferum]|uniref:Uncharacterized protein n=1 Tax=Papaver somniferum TaxID=3469 RepID=A0A4Y7IM69_PAPSO|nr:diacylglycerol O-acyltransferase 3, cytosolic-like [Papaver somniferum]RZC48812.1 hypothetical protein C5167_017235 [Papaver somniferum]